MSTATPTGAPSGAPAPIPTTIDVSSTPHVPLSRLVKVELRKSYDTRAGIWLLGITAFLAAAVMVIVLIVVLVQDEPITLNDFVGVANFISGFLLPVLGIMLVTSEWSQRTAMVTFTLEPHRGRVVLAKLVAGLLLALIVSLIATLSALVVNAVYSVASGGGDWHFGLLELLGFLLTQVIAMLTGFAFATLLLNTAAAIVVYFAYSFLVPTVFAIAAQFLGWFEDVQPWIDFAQAQSPLIDASMTGEDWVHLLVSGLIWLAIPVALGLRRILRAELK
jgi:ABC-2 type transport system permease protein